MFLSRVNYYYMFGLSENCQPFVTMCFLTRRCIHILNGAGAVMNITLLSATTFCFPGVFSRPALRALPSFSKPSPTRQRQLRGPDLLREPGSPGRPSPAG